MKTRKSDTVTESKCKSNIVINNKTKVKKIAKESFSDSSYRDTHNIGRRKSTNSVITYSLNSHLFFDIYAKFDKNASLPQNATVNISRKSSRNSSVKLKDKKSIRSSVSADVSTDAMSEYHSNKSSPNRVKIINESESPSKDDSSASLSELKVCSPFKSPSQISPPKKVTLATKGHENNTETFLNGLTNKTMFKKKVPKKKLNNKLQLKTKKVKLRVSERLSKNLIKSTNKDMDIMKPKCILNGRKGLLRRKTKSNIDCQVNALINLNNDEITNSKCMNDPIEILIDKDEKNIELKVDFGNDESRNNNTMTTKMEEKKINLKEINNHVYSTEVNDIKDVIPEPLNEEKKKVEEMKTYEKKINLGSKISLKKKSKKSLNCFFDITTTGSQRECEKSVTKNPTIVEPAVRPRETVDHKDQGRIGFKNSSVLKKGLLINKKEEDIFKISVEDDNESETLWLWHGDSQERTIQLQLDGAVVTKTCYPAIKHAKDDVVIRVMDCVMLRSGDQEPYLAKITAFFDDEESGKKMMAVLWYYRPEHTDQGRLLWHTEVDVYASKHLDTNSVDCIDDKAFVLPIELYSRFMSYQKRTGSTSRQGLTSRLVPVIVDDEPLTAETIDPSMAVFASSFYYGPLMQTSFPSEMTSSNVFVCRGLYDIVEHTVLGDLVPLVSLSSSSSLLVSSLSLSLVPGPPERCASVDSAMSISSCDSSPRPSSTTDRPLPAISTNHLSKYRQTLSSTSSSSSSTSCSPSSITAVMPPLSNGRHIPYYHYRR